MSTFREANQVRVSLKMKLSQYSWYNSSVVSFAADDYSVVIYVNHIDNSVRKVITPVIDGVNVRAEVGQ